MQDRARHQTRSPLGGPPPTFGTLLSATATCHPDLISRRDSSFGLDHVDGQVPGLVRAAPGCAGAAGRPTALTWVVSRPRFSGKASPAPSSCVTTTGAGLELVSRGDVACRIHRRGVSPPSRVQVGVNVFLFEAPLLELSSSRRRVPSCHGLACESAQRSRKLAHRGFSSVRVRRLAGRGPIGQCSGYGLPEISWLSRSCSQRIRAGSWWSVSPAPFTSA